MLKAAGLAHCLKLVHFHVGSQVPDILTIKRAVREAARYYAKLAQDGPRARLPRCRRRARRRLRRLAHDVRQLDELLARGIRAATSSTTSWTSATPRGVAHPAIVSESGRAIVAHHSVLVVEAFGSIEKDTRPSSKSRPSENDHKLLARHSRRASSISSAATAWRRLHDAQQIKEEAQRCSTSACSISRQGEDRDASTGRSRSRSSNSARGLKYVPEEVKELEIVARRPVHLQLLRLPVAARSLGARPALPDHADPPPERRVRTRNGTLVDITCDSDGKVSKFIDLQDVKDTLPLHPHHARASRTTSASS